MPSSQLYLSDYQYFAFLPLIMVDFQWINIHPQNADFRRFFTTERNSIFFKLVHKLQLKNLHCEASA